MIHPVTEFYRDGLAFKKINAPYGKHLVVSWSVQFTTELSRNGIVHRTSDQSGFFFLFPKQYIPSESCVSENIQSSSQRRQSVKHSLCIFNGKGFHKIELGLNYRNPKSIKQILVFFQWCDTLNFSLKQSNQQIGEFLSGSPLLKEAKFIYKKSQIISSTYY